MATNGKTIQFSPSELVVSHESAGDLDQGHGED